MLSKRMKKPDGPLWARMFRYSVIVVVAVAVFHSAGGPLAAEEPSDLDRALSDLEETRGPATLPSRDIASVRAGQANMRLIDISLVGSFALGASSLDRDHLEQVQGHLHDPRKKGFSVTSLELSFSGAIDPYFVAEAHVNLSHGAELEEAFITSQSLPYGLQLEAGQFFTEFGILNPQHPHTWAYMDAPVILTRVMGDHGLNGPGVRLGWLAPVPWFSQVHLGAQNADGFYMKSFLGERADGGGHSHGDDDEHYIGGYEPVDRELMKGSELAYLLRWENAFDITDRTVARIGFSGMMGPNSTGHQGHTTMYGADLYVKWVPARNFRGFPFLVWQTEFMRREYVVDKMPDTDRLANTFAILGGEFFEPYDDQEVFTRTALQNLVNDSLLSTDTGNFGLAVAVLTGQRDFSSLSEEQAQRAVEAAIRIGNPTETLHDWGYYTQILFGFERGWTAGIRYEYASGSGESRVDGGNWISGMDIEGRDRDPYRDTRVRVSPLITYQPTHFTRFRFQYNQEWADHLRRRRVLQTSLNEVNPSLPAFPIEFVIQDQGRAAWSVWFGAEFIIGFHPAHPF
jgi:hypothetical protein